MGGKGKGEKRVKGERVFPREKGGGDGRAGVRWGRQGSDPIGKNQNPNKGVWSKGKKRRKKGNPKREGAIIEPNQSSRVRELRTSENLAQSGLGGGGGT